MAEMTQPWYLRPFEPFERMRTVPWRRLWLLTAAVFLLFMVFGFFDDLMAQGTRPYAVAILASLYTGLDAALWILVLYRGQRILIVGMVALQFFNSPLITAVANRMVHAFALQPVPRETGVRFAATGILIVVVASYALFISYIRAEGKESYRIRSQLELAHGIQKTLVPPVHLRTDLFEVYGISEPSDKVGGDLVDAVLLPGGDVVAYVADIAGHGLPAGILMGMLKTAARTALLDAGTGHPSVTLPELLEKLNRVLPDVKEPQMYATLTAFRLNADGRVWFAMAASPPVLHWSPQRQDRKLMQEEQYPLGLLPVSGFTGEGIEVGKGDLLVVATDGVLEVSDRTDQEFGIERVESAITAEPRGSLEALAAKILKSARAFGQQIDDQTLLLIRRL